MKGTVMRRKDRQITNLEEIISVIKKCDVCRLALNDDGYPYIIPLNFGLKVDEGKISLIFHSALEGKKTELIKKDERAAFEMDTDHILRYDREKGYCTMSYESVAGRGRIRILPDGEKRSALQSIMNRYHTDGAYFNPRAIPRTLVYALEVEEITGKRKLPK